MNRLLSADFARLLKNKYFWICSIFMAGFGIFMQVMNYVSCISMGAVPHPDTIFFSFSLLTCILLSAFISLFIGTDYSDGTMRSKLVIGHTRCGIYLSGLITCTAAGLLMCLSCLIASLAAGLPLSGFFESDIRLVIGTALGIAVMTAAFSSIAFCSLAALSAASWRLFCSSSRSSGICGCDGFVSGLISLGCPVRILPVERPWPVPGRPEFLLPV